jgi:secondary thiamine-phosphate synthase enzyme
MTHTHQVQIRTQGESDVRDVTPSVLEAVRESRASEGIACVFVVGSTAGITTIEFESGLVEDLQRTMESLAPRDARYAHEAHWGDDNGHSHIRATLLGPSVTIPLVKGELACGTWQQIVLCEFDTRPREREVIIQIVGDK